MFLINLVSILISGRRGLDLAGLPVRQHSFNLPPNGHEMEPPMMRTPFSPIASTDSSKSNINNVLEDLNKKHDIFQKTLATNNNTPFSTPSKTIQPTEQENIRTPQAMAIPVPSTPSTVSIPMQTAFTPAPAQKSITPAILAAGSVEDVIEYSFEERRAGFVVPRPNLKTVIHV